MVGGDREKDLELRKVTSARCSRKRRPRRFSEDRWPRRSRSREETVGPPRRRAESVAAKSCCTCCRSNSTRRRSSTPSWSGTQGRRREAEEADGAHRGHDQGDRSRAGAGRSGSRRTTPIRPCLCSREGRFWRYSRVGRRPFRSRRKRCRGSSSAGIGLGATQGRVENAQWRRPGAVCSGSDRSALVAPGVAPRPIPARRPISTKEKVPSFIRASTETPGAERTSPPAPGSADHSGSGRSPG